MADINELKKKFPARKKQSADDGKGPMHRKSTRAAVKAIAREYEMKKAELAGSGAPAFRRGPLFYGLVVLMLVVVGSMVVSALKGGVGFGKERIERKPLQAQIAAGVHAALATLL